MTAPTPTQFVEGQGAVSADNLNTNVQAAESPAQMRSVVGVPGMNLLLQGQVTQGDDGTGFYWWNALGVHADDDFNYITPYGSGSGQWERYDINGGDISVGEYGSNSSPLTIVNTMATTLNFTGAVSVTSEFGFGGAVSTINIDGLDMIDGSLTLTGVTEQFAGTNITFTYGESGQGTINSYNPIIYGGDLVYLTGDPPQIVQSTFANDFHSTITLSLPGTVTPGNLLLLAQCSGPAGYSGPPSGWTVLISAYPASGFYGGATISYFNVTATNQNSVVITGNSSAGGSGDYVFFHEITSVSAISAWESGFTNNSTNFTTPTDGTTYGYASAFYGLLVTAGISYTGSSPKNFTGPSPLSSVILTTGYAGANFEGSPAVGCEAWLPNADGPQTMSVWSSQSNNQVGFLVQLAGNPTINLTPTLAVYESLVIDGYTIPPTLTTAGMIEFEGPDTLAAYLDIAQNGALLSSTITELNFTGNTDPLLLSGTTLNIPAQSFVEGTIAATGVLTLEGNISLIGTANPTAYVPGIVAGNAITLTGGFPNTTISATSTLGANTAFENSGTYLGTSGTINAGTNLTASSYGGIVTLSAPLAAFGGTYHNISGAVTIGNTLTATSNMTVVFNLTHSSQYYSGVFCRVNDIDVMAEQCSIPTTWAGGSFPVPGGATWGFDSLGPNPTIFNVYAVY